MIDGIRMKAEENILLQKRQQDFTDFYAKLLPALVDFIGKIGIQPAHEVLNHAVQFEPYVSQATGNFVVEDEDDRTWLKTKMGYYIGEYFVQKH